MKELIEIGRKAKEASKQLAHLNTDQKNRVLRMVADLLERSTSHILGGPCGRSETGGKKWDWKGAIGGKTDPVGRTDQRDRIRL